MSLSKLNYEDYPYRKRMPNHKKFLDVLVERNVQSNSFLPKYHYYKLDENEKRMETAQYLLTEFTLVNNLINKYTADFKGFKDIKSDDPYYNIKFLTSIRNTMGYIKKTPNYKNIQTLIQYSRTCASRDAANSDGAKEYLNKIGIIEQSYKLLEDNEEVLSSALSAEVHTAKNHEATLYLEFYTRAVALLEMTFDVLYSSSINATFKQNSVNEPVLENVTFEYTGNLDEPLDYIAYINNIVIKGELKTLLNNGAAIKEHYEQLTRNILSEGFLDVAFSLISNNKYFDLLFIPLYVIRFVIYLFKYMGRSYEIIASNFDNAIRITKEHNVKPADIEHVKSEGKQKEAIFTQAVNKSSKEVEEEIKEERPKMEDPEESPTLKQPIQTSTPKPLTMKAPPVMVTTPAPTSTNVNSTIQNKLLI